MRARASAPGSILLDWDLPARDGLTVLRGLAADGTLATSRVVMLTARASEREILTALELGASDHIAKPFSLAVLMQRVERVLGALITESVLVVAIVVLVALIVVGWRCSSSTALVRTLVDGCASARIGARAGRAAERRAPRASPTRPPARRCGRSRASARSRCSRSWRRASPGRSGEALNAAARERGVIADAERECASRRWRRRLHAVRVLSLLGGGEEAVPPLLDDPRAEVRAQAAEWAAGHPESGGAGW